MQNKMSYANTKLTLLEWNTKEDKFMKNTLYVLRYAKGHLSGWSDVRQSKMKYILAITELH